VPAERFRAPCIEPVFAVYSLGVSSESKRLFGLSAQPEAGAPVCDAMDAVGARGEFDVEWRSIASRVQW
jgi:hypothetical protein